MTEPMTRDDDFELEIAQPLDAPDDADTIRAAVGAHPRRRLLACLLE